MTKTFKLSYGEMVAYEKIVEAKTREEAEELLAKEIQDLSTWEVVNAESDFNSIEEVN